MVQLNSEYSDKINYMDWPTETEFRTPVDWTLDSDDEKQVEANIEGLQTIKRYLLRKLHATQKNTAAAEE